MIVIKNIYFGITVYQKWFSDALQILDCFKILVYKQSCITSCKGFVKKKTYTLISDLTLSENDIMMNFTSTVRNEVKRSIREGISYNPKEKIDNFLCIYNEFAILLGLNKISEKKIINMFNNQQIAITSCTIDGVIVAVHSYLLDVQLKKVRLLHSATIRLSDGVDRNKVARANKFLHYEDMKNFKKENFLFYDWGGIAYNSNNKGLKGINNFKESFGGRLIQENEIQTFLYFLLSKFYFI